MAHTSWWHVHREPLRPLRTIPLPGVRTETGRIVAAEQHRSLPHAIVGQRGHAGTRCDGRARRPGQAIPFPGVPEVAIAVREGPTEQHHPAAGDVIAHRGRNAGHRSAHYRPRDPIHPIVLPGLGPDAARRPTAEQHAAVARLVVDEAWPGPGARIPSRCHACPKQLVSLPGSVAIWPPVHHGAAAIAVEGDVLAIARPEHSGLGPTPRLRKRAAKQAPPSQCTQRQQAA